MRCDESNCITLDTIEVGRHAKFTHQLIEFREPVMIGSTAYKYAVHNKTLLGPTNYYKTRREADDTWRAWVSYRDELLTRPRSNT